MTCRRVLSLLAMLALLAAPFGRIAAAEGMTVGHRAPMAMADHCEDVPSSHHGKTNKAAIDCMIACAALATADSTSPAVTASLAAAPVSIALPLVAGLHPEADPPPPRFS